MARGGRQGPRVRPGGRPLTHAATPVPAPIPGPVELLDEIPQLDELLAQHTAAMGSDAVPYRNHAYRVANRLRRFGVPSTRPQNLRRRWPDAGFHSGLVKQELKWLRMHPWNPLP